MTDPAKEAQRLVKRLLKDKTIEEIAVAIPASAREVYRWKAGTHPPRDEKMEKLRELAKG